MLHPEFPRTALFGAMTALLVSLAPVAAQASDAAMIQKSVTVRVSDLDVSKPADAAALRLRIRRAAAEACSDNLAGGVRAADPDRDCMAVAIANALENFRSANLADGSGHKP